MRIVTIHFDQRREYGHFLKAFAESCKANSSLPLQVVNGAKVKNTRAQSFKMCSNTHKLELMNSVIQEADEDILLMDCDMLVLKEIKDIFDLVETIGYTYADYQRTIPINGGVIVVKNTTESKKSFQTLTNVNAEMMRNRSLHYRFRRIYAGMNQSAMGYMLEHGAQWTKLPMSIWNLCEPWTLIPETRIVHYKSILGRAALINNRSYHPELVDLWQRYHHSLTPQE